MVPVLRVHCGKCHAGDARQGGFSLNTREAKLAGGDSGAAGFVAGKAAESEIIARTARESGSRQCLPDGGCGRSPIGPSTRQGLKAVMPVAMHFVGVDLHVEEIRPDNRLNERPRGTPCLQRSPKKSSVVLRLNRPKEMEEIAAGRDTAWSRFWSLGAE